MIIASEDDLGRSLLMRLVTDLCVDAPKLIRDSRGGQSYIESRLESYFQLSQRQPTLVLIDQDSSDCAVAKRDAVLQKCGISPTRQNIFRLHVARREAESWVLADVDGLARLLNVSAGIIDPSSETTTRDPKEYLLNVASRSRSSDIRNSFITRKKGALRPGIAYNRILTGFVAQEWDREAALHRNESLRRLCNRLQSFSRLGTL